VSSSSRRACASVRADTLKNATQIAIHATSPGTPRSTAIWSGVLCRWLVERRSDARDRVSPDEAEPRVQHREPVARGVVPEITDGAEAGQHARLDDERPGDHDRERPQHEAAPTEDERAPHGADGEAEPGAADIGEAEGHDSEPPERRHPGALPARARQAR